MKKKQHKSIEFNKPVHLYLEDLHEIESILKEELKVKELEITFDEYEAKSIKEIPEGTENVSTYLVFQTSNPNISISIYKHSTSIWLSSTNLELEGAIAKITDLLTKRTRKFIFYSFKVLNLGISLIFITVAILSSWFGRMSRNIQIILLLIFLLTLTLWILTILKPVKSIIEFKEKKKTPTFFQRNKDRIIVGLLVGIPVAIFSFLLGFIFRK